MDGDRLPVGNAGAASDEELAAALLSATGFNRTLIAAALGDVNGRAGTDALRSVLDPTVPGSRDLQCAALLALAKRCGEQATPDMAYALRGVDLAVRSYAVACLAGAGDDRAWDEVRDWLVTRVNQTRTPTPGNPSEVGLAVAYLARHSQPGSPRLVRLIDVIRGSWSQLRVDEREWFVQHWPEAVPDGPNAVEVAPPDPERLRNWAREPLFERLTFPPFW